MGCEEAGKSWELKLPKSFSTFPSQPPAFKNAPDQNTFHRATALLCLISFPSTQHFKTFSKQNMTLVLLRAYKDY